MEYQIRLARSEDCKDIVRMIRELAEFEKLSEQVEITEEVLQKDGFAEDPFYKCLVAELQPEQRSTEGFRIIGYALYFFTYSTWKGRALFLEDLYVMPEFRGKGIGTKLMSKVAEVGLSLGCTRLQLSVLDWNQAARDVYVRRGAMNMTAAEGWHLYRFQGDALKALAEGTMKA
ncbi:thialysine N-epsilon-acetyltransferase [Microcaecilia unicolor]|uniref:Diamine acetyltransferase 2 n=1 Tax=Microcaecilia unicolor TaxID=1415580 RepID=A0A6P7WQX6_9AMPH|nr:diamine acetyltransferase 2 [Microcaecilia unicolor]